jgi:hypothetical protein
MGASKTTSPERTPDRESERNGVLAGLNLREVAAEAGVNRGLVYHYGADPVSRSAVWLFN